MLRQGVQTVFESVSFEESLDISKQADVVAAPTAPNLVNTEPVTGQRRLTCCDCGFTFTFNSFTSLLRRFETKPPKPCHCPSDDVCLYNWHTTAFIVRHF